MKYQMRANFQANFARLFRRGIYKVFLEERERQCKDAHERRYDFIRAFARYDLNDLPVYYLKPKFQIVFFALDDILHPEIRFTDHSEEIDSKYRFYSYSFMGHTLALPTHSTLQPERLKMYKEFLVEDDSPFGKHLIEIKLIENLDFRFNYMKN